MAVVLILFGAALHTYTWAVESTTFSVPFWLLSLSPYLVGAILLFLFKRLHAAAGAVLLPALLDAGSFYSAFVDPEGSTAALGVFFVSLLNIGVLVPIGAAIGWWVGYRINLTDDEMRSNKSLERTRGR
jgi:hypothetical protein